VTHGLSAFWSLPVYPLWQVKTVKYYQSTYCYCSGFIPGEINCEKSHGFLLLFKFIATHSSCFQCVVLLGGLLLLLFIAIIAIHCFLVVQISTRCWLRFDIAWNLVFLLSMDLSS
jgi:uncharacterized integral membrane protein